MISLKFRCWSKISHGMTIKLKQSVFTSFQHRFFNSLSSCFSIWDFFLFFRPLNFFILSKSKNLEQQFPLTEDFSLKIKIVFRTLNLLIQQPFSHYAFFVHDPDSILWKIPNETIISWISLKNSMPTPAQPRALRRVIHPQWFFQKFLNKLRLNQLVIMLASSDQPQSLISSKPG